MLTGWCPWRPGAAPVVDAGGAQATDLRAGAAASQASIGPTVDRATAFGSSALGRQRGGAAGRAKPGLSSATVTAAVPDGHGRRARYARWTGDRLPVKVNGEPVLGKVVALRALSRSPGSRSANRPSASSTSQTLPGLTPLEVTISESESTAMCPLHPSNPRACAKPYSRPPLGPVTNSCHRQDCGRS
jgi:hypothetical protein